MFGKNDNLAVIKTLTSTLNDSINGYRDAADNVDNPDLRSLFTDFAGKREAAATELKAEVRRLGGEPDEDGSALGGLHQSWLDLKAAVTGRDDKAVINEVERGEDYLKEKFEAALDSDTLTGDSRMVVHNAFRSVREGHDRMSSLKHGLEG
jgi:uncharacterized protein (TIGR02284 family)